MIPKLRGYLCVAAAWALSAPAFGSVVYDNTLTDTGDTAAYDANGYTEIGDQIHLGGTQRRATSAIVQFFNQGGLGSFDGSLGLFLVGSPVGAQIGSTIVLTGITAPANSSFNVTFTIPNVTVPDDLVFTLSVANQSAGVVIIGPNLFEPPIIGSSDNGFYIVKSGGIYSQSTITAANIFFQLNVADVPEPATLAISAVGLLGLALFRRRRWSS